jgi:hypothetical protein
LTVAARILCLLTAVLTWQSPAAAQRARSLAEEVGPIELAASADAFRAKGVTMADAVNDLRGRTEFPICFESVERDAVADALTLGQVLNEYRRLEKEKGLSARQEANLNIYERMTHEKRLQDSVGVRVNVFPLSVGRIQVRALLDRLVALDDEYSWHDAGTVEAPLVVIEPRRRSVLGWAVPALCGPRQTARRWLGAGTKVTELFGAHAIGFMYGTHVGKDAPEAAVDLCHEGMTARDLINQLVTAGGPRWSWTLSGIKGLRVLTFNEDPAR